MPKDPPPGKPKFAAKRVAPPPAPRGGRDARGPSRAGGPGKFGPASRGMTKDDRPPTRRGPDDLGLGAWIIHEDEDVIVVDKPANMLTAGMAGERRLTLFDLIKRHLKEGLGAPRGRSRGRDERATGAGPARPRVGAGVIHRLDKEASGLLVFSKTDRAFQWLKEDFKAKRVHRIYLAVLEGEMGSAGEQGTIQSFLKEESDGRVRSIAQGEFRGSIRPDPESEENVARPAVTHFRVLAVARGHTLVQVRLETGRKHQIRVHFADRGHPLVGDKRYGAKTDPGNRIALHAAELGFTHPSTGMKERYTSHAPRAFYALCGAEALMPKDSPGRAGPAAAPAARGPAADTSWEGVAEWYDELVEAGQSDHYPRVIVPGAVRLVRPSAGMRVLDVACGQGVVSRALAGLGASVVGVDGAPSLIEAAKARGGEHLDFHVGDARALGTLGLEPESFDAAACVMALSNIEPLEPVLAGVASLLKPRGRFIWIITHPAFRAPDQTDWGWDDKSRVQFRRVEGYLSPGFKAIQMHPGRAPDVTTMTFHRPLQTYVRLLAEAGFAITALEEWPSMRTSQPGPRAEAENRARREIPLFLAVEATLRAEEEV